MIFPVIDLHCDLLSYLEMDAKRTPYDLPARCSVSQLRQGNVQTQVFAVYVKTEACSLEKGLAQVQIYQELPKKYPLDFSLEEKPSQAIAMLMAFENASGFCSEEEPLQEGLQRLDSITQNVAKPLYISLTWNSENRFGGGALTKVGLKEDGRQLLEKLHQTEIAVDLSHASDYLAYEIIDYIERRGLDIPLMASHSNARAVIGVPRNLPDEIAKEIFRRGGVIGLNLYRTFIGANEEFIAKHILHWLELGGKDHIALGADFFYEADLSPVYRDRKGDFLPDYQDASCYGHLLHFLQKELSLEESLMQKIAYQNAQEFITTKRWVTSS